jgi:hypothetical protein
MHFLINTSMCCMASVASCFVLQEDMDDMLAHEEDLGGEELGGANHAAQHLDSCTLNALHTGPYQVQLECAALHLLAGGHG